MLRLVPIGVLALSLIGSTAMAAGTGRSLAAPIQDSGYGNARGSVMGTFDPSTRDANNNRIVKDGLIQSGTGGSQISTDGTMGGAAMFQTGAINSTNYAVGNLINLSIVGSWNTVVLNSVQNNYGAVTAITSINGTSQASTGQLN
ncbi:MAG: holdfast anchoring protein HfaA [Alphaproteobacteria bacterium]